MKSKVKITFIGTGDAANTGGKAHQSILIKSDSYCLLVDCGANTLLRFQELQINPNDVDAVLFTHFHADHFLGIVNFDLSLIFDYPRERSIVYAGPEGIEEKYHTLCQLGYPSLYPNDKFQREFHTYTANKKYSLGNSNVTIETIAMQHAPESLGYRIAIDGKLIAISGDTEWHENIIALAQNNDLFICESYHYNVPENKIGHMAYEEIKKNAHRMNCKKIILVHAGNEMLAQKDKCRIPLVSDGDSIEI